MENVDAILARKVANALRRLSDPSSATKGDFFLQEAYDKLGSEGKLIAELKLPPTLQSALETARANIAAKLATLTSGSAAEEREALATVLSKGLPVPPDYKDDVDLISQIGLPMVVAPADVMRDVVAGTEHNPIGWMKTPSVVVSQGSAACRRASGDITSAAMLRAWNSTRQCRRARSPLREAIRKAAFYASIQPTNCGTGRSATPSLT